MKRVLAVFLFSATLAQAKVNPAFVSHFANYNTFKQAVLDKVSSAQKTVWLATKKLRDGDLSSALYLAKYRQVQVLVVLCKEESCKNDNGEQIFQLRSSNIPVVMADEVFFQRPQSLVLVDGELLLANAAFDAALQHSTDTKYVIQKATEPYKQMFAESFQKLFAAQPTPQAADTHPTAKPQIQQTPTQPGPVPQPVQQTPTHSGTQGFVPQSPHAAGAPSAFNSPLPVGPVAPNVLWPGYKPYRSPRKYQPPPKGVARRLPKVPKWVKK